MFFFILHQKSGQTEYAVCRYVNAWKQEKATRHVNNHPARKCTGCPGIGRLILRSSTQKRPLRSDQNVIRSHLGMTKRQQSVLGTLAAVCTLILVIFRTFSRSYLVVRAPFTHKRFRRSTEEGRLDSSRRGLGSIRAVCRSWRALKSFFFFVHSVDGAWVNQIAARKTFPQCCNTRYI